MIPITKDLYRIVYAFEYLQHGSYPYLATEKERETIDHDMSFILTRYNELKWKPNMTFSAAMQIAKVEFMYGLLSGEKPVDAVEVAR